MDEPNYQLQMQSQQIEGLSPLAVGDQKLNRHLGYFSGTMINGRLLVKIYKEKQWTYWVILLFFLVWIVSQIIGTGIFSNSSYILANCGSGGMMMILWWVGAIFAITGVWNYLELGTMASIESVYIETCKNLTYPLHLVSSEVILYNHIYILLSFSTNLHDLKWWGTRIFSLSIS